MLKICAWCKKKLGYVAPLGDKSVTHGMCFTCKGKWVADIGYVLKAERPIISGLYLGEYNGNI